MNEIERTMRAGPHTVVYLSEFESPLGRLRAGATGEGVIFLDFLDHPGAAERLERRAERYRYEYREGGNEHTSKLEAELASYFRGELEEFETPLAPEGTDFQHEVWRALCAIPHSETRSYADLARSVGRPTAYRAVAQANARNPIPIVVPCHRVISADGKLGGYSSGLERKVWLLGHENTRKGVG